MHFDGNFFPSIFGRHQQNANTNPATTNLSNTDDWGRTIDGFVNAVISDLHDPHSSFYFPGRLFGGSCIPRMDLHENDSAYVIKSDLPGVKKSDLSITIDENNVINIADTRKLAAENASGFEVLKPSNETSTGSSGTLRILERCHGNFKRSIRLPSDADTDKVHAKLEDGLLELTISKKASDKKSIKVM
ncbi:hypothetical protein HDU76_006425 [Blyttiomyces sp. JEL0837]|nr:hypothetical protein HDU76_006425 [Blyttiomyces sp. JEL0837]